MTRKDFIVIAETLRGLNLSSEDARAVREAFADRLALTNSHFDRVRFLQASTPEDCVEDRTLAA